LLPKISREDALVEFDNALDTVATATVELESSQQRGTATTATGDDSSNTVSAFESPNIAASVIPPKHLHSSDGTDAVDRNARCAVAELPGDEEVLTSICSISNTMSTARRDGRRVTRRSLK